MTVSDIESATITTPHEQGGPPRRRSPCHGSSGGDRVRLGFGVPARRRAAPAALTAVAGFFRGVRGASAIETALSVSILVGALALLMQVVNTVFVDDQAGRAARAAALALALDPATDPWGPVWKELYSTPNHACTTDWTASEEGACGGWTLAVKHGVSPAALAAARDPNLTAPPAGGDLVLVGLQRQPAPVPGVPSANASPPGTARTLAELVGMDAVGVARNEPEA